MRRISVKTYLEPTPYKTLKASADSKGLSIAAYIRMLILEQLHGKDGA